MMSCKDTDAVSLGMFSPEQLLNIDKHFFVFIFHVLAYLIDIRIIELNDQKSNFILSGTVNRFNQLLPDGRQLKIQEIMMGILQVSHQSRNRQFLQMILHPVVLFCQKVHHNQKSIAVDSIHLADLPDRLVPETQ